MSKAFDLTHTINKGHTFPCCTLLYHKSIQKKERNVMRNKERGFPNQNNNKLEGEPRAKAEFASKRADGTINTHPQERMHASNQRTDQ